MMNLNQDIFSKKFLLSNPTQFYKSNDYKFHLHNLSFRLPTPPHCQLLPKQCSHSHKWKSQVKNLIGLPQQIFASLVPSVHAAEAVAAKSPALALSDLPPGALVGSESVIQNAQLQPNIIVFDAEIAAVLAQETGKERLQKMFSHEGGHFSPEVEFWIICTKNAMFINFFLMTIFGSRKAKEDYIRESQHKKYATKFIAMRKFNDNVFVGGMKAGAWAAIRTGVFITLFLGTSQSISVYRNKTSLLEYTSAGFFTGSLLRMHLGLKGWFAGGLIGSVFGSVFGAALVGAMKLSGETQEERHSWRIHEDIKERKEAQGLAVEARRSLEQSAASEAVVESS